MTTATLITAVYDLACQKKEDVYAFIGEQIGENEAQCKTISQGLSQRESIGSIQIAPGVVLPHFEGEQLAASHIYLIYLQPTLCPWSSQINEVRVVVAVLLKPDETLAVKQELAAFMRKLADDTLIETLLTISTEEELNTLVKKLSFKN